MNWHSPVRPVLRTVKAQAESGVQFECMLAASLVRLHKHCQR
jgi:hypothetical protein